MNMRILEVFAGALLFAASAMGAPGGNGEIVEAFDDASFFDVRSTAYWDLAGSGRLVAGIGLGGNGADGAFVATAGDTQLDTTANGGVFNFTRFVVPPGARVIFSGAFPARVRVLRRADIQGMLDLRGGAGETAVFRGQVTAGGVAGPGGGRGGRGNPNGTISMSPAGEVGESVPRVMNTVSCNRGDGLRLGGGCAGGRDTSSAGSGGGGGHRDFGASDNGASPQSGFGGIAYGIPAIADLRGGSGGGGGGNDDDGLPFVNDDPGGAGGGGGGALSLEVGGVLVIAGTIEASGGRGGNGFMQSGAGGGGSGGALRLRAGRVADLTSGKLLARGGTGGTLSAPGRPAGGGSPGRIRLEDADGVVGIDRTRVTVDPAESQGNVRTTVSLGRSVGASRFYDSGVATPRYAFDGADPATGALLTGPAVTDLVLPNGIPAGTTARIVFTGAPEDVANPGFPDLTQEVGPVTDVTALDGLRFIRFAIRFDVGSSLPVATVPEVDRLRVRFFCP